MAMAPVAYALWQRHLRFDPDDPIWPNRDRFVLSMGHASMLLYSMLHLAGVKAVNPKYETLGDALGDASTTSSASASSTAGARAIPSTAGPPASRRPRDRSARAWRRASAWRSRASGWPRTSTGPGFEMFGFDVYALAGDGCMMEGDLERGRVAGRPPEARQPVLDLRQQPHHDRRATPSWRSARTWPRGSSAYGWNVTRVGDANDLDDAGPGLRHLRRRRATGPRLIIVDSHIGYGAPTKQDTHAAHGEPLGEEEIRLAKRFYGWPEDAKFLVPDGVREHFAAGDRRARREAARRVDGAVRGLQGGVSEGGRRAGSDAAPPAPRRLGRRHPGLRRRCQGNRRARRLGQGAERRRQKVPWLIGGSADLAPSTKTRLTFDGAGDFDGRQLRRPQLALRRARARDGRRAQRDVAGQGAALRLGVSHLQRLRPARRCGSPRSWRSRSSTSSRTTRSAWARTARPISRSSSCCRCVRSPA